MNKERRKAIGEIVDKLGDLKIEVEEIRDDEEQALEALPESFQYGEKGDKMQEGIDALDNAISSLEEASDYLMEAQQ